MLPSIRVGLILWTSDRFCINMFGGHKVSFHRILVLAAVGMGLVCGGTQRASAAPPSIDYQAAVLRQVNDNHGRQVLLRRGYYDAAVNQGFGYDKMDKKHNLSDAGVALAVVNNPGQSGIQHGPDSDDDAAAGSAGDRWWYRGVWQHRQCTADHRECTGPLEQIVVRVIVEFEPWASAPQHGEIGLITAYCEGMTRCPDWINHLQAG